MGVPHIYGFFFFVFIFFSNIFFSSALTATATSSQINSNSVLVALLDSHYTELAELVEKALLLHQLELVVGKSNITIFAPNNDALEKGLDAEFKRFLLEPGNLRSLQTLLLYHVLPGQVDSVTLPSGRHHATLSKDRVEMSRLGPMVVRPNDVVRPDGVIHGIERVLIPRSVQEDFNRRRNLRSISAVLPEGAPVVDPRTNKLVKRKNNNKLSSGPPPPPGSEPTLSIYQAMSHGPSMAPAPAPGPGGPHHHFDGESQVKDFIHTLLHYGGYNELADILVNLTSLATEMGKLVSEGYVITVLAPNDEAMSKLTTDQLSEPGAPEQIVYYHVIPEYQTEESMYNAVRRFGKVKYDTLRLPHKVAAEEADGSVRFGSGDGSAYLFDPDIYTDGRISVQGIDGVLFPIEEKNDDVDRVKKNVHHVKVVPKERRAKLLETTCWMLGSMGRHFNACQ
ncbi:fasciclin-like arabinogalactan protein 15 [Silene latifolia]|uniref:fasciclin-like arabinogalactan protein 15 n=1 Tax=Silene latifolia TaxID=37657 RepID=UPI003D7833A5